MSFLKIDKIYISPNKDEFWLGTALKVVAILDISTADSVKISIYDYARIELVNAVSMTKDANRVYSYTYQSNEDGSEGTYSIIVEALSGSNTSVEKVYVDFIDPELEN
jgi:hypothetical protein